MCCRKLQCSLGTCKDRRQHLHRGFGGLLRTGLSSCMDHIAKLALRKIEATNITRDKFNSPIGRKVRTLRTKGIWASCQCGHSRIQRELTIDIAEALQQPSPKEACSSCNEDALITHLCPQRLRLSEDQVKITVCNRWCCIHEMAHFVCR